MLEDTTAFVTGASGGIGRTIAVTLAEYGADVALAARSDGIEETADMIDDASRTLPVEMDVTDEASVKKSITATVEAFGGLDCLVNNAGIAGPTAGVEAVDLADWQATFDVNVTGAFLTTKHSAESLRRSDRGSIVNIASISGKRPLADRTPYTASKMALVGLTRTLAFEFGPDDVTVNTVCPGATKGPRIDRVLEEQADARGITYEEAKAQVFTDDVALGELVRPEDVAEMVAYLASDRGRQITAQDLNVDGGTTWY